MFYQNKFTRLLKAMDTIKMRRNFGKNSQKIITSTRIFVRRIYRIAFDKYKLPKSFSALG